MTTATAQADTVPTTGGLRAGAAAKQGVYAIVDQAIVSLASFAGTLMVGWVSKEELGIYALGMTMFWLIAGIPNALVWTPYTARASRLTDKRRQQYAAASGTLSLAIATLLLVSSFVVGGIARLSDASDWLFPFLMAIGPLAFTMTLREHARRLYVADFAGPKVLLLDVPICIATVVLQAMFYASGSLNAFWGLIVTAVAALPAVWVVGRHSLFSRKHIVRALATLQANWRYGRWLLIVAIAWLASDALLRSLLVAVHGPAALGSLAGAFAIVALVNPILLAMTSFARSVASRHLADSNEEQVVARALRGTQWAACAGAIAFLLLTIGGQFATSWLLGNSYNDPLLLGLLAAAVCLEGIAVPMEAAFVALESGPQLCVVAVLRLALSLLIALTLVWTWGPVGIAIAMFSRSVLVLGLYSVLLSRRHRSQSASAASDAQFVPRPVTAAPLPPKSLADREPVVVELGS